MTIWFSDICKILSFCTNDCCNVLFDFVVCRKYINLGLNKLNKRDSPFLKVTAKQSDDIEVDVTLCVLK